MVISPKRTGLGKLTPSPKSLEAHWPLRSRVSVLPGLQNLHFSLLTHPIAQGNEVCS